MTALRAFGTKIYFFNLYNIGIFFKGEKPIQKLFS